MLDSGSELNNSKFDGISDRLAIAEMYRSTYHHKTVGAGERANQSLMGKIRMLSEYRNLPSKKVLDHINYVLKYLTIGAYIRHSVFLNRFNCLCLELTKNQVNAKSQNICTKSEVLGIKKTDH